MRALLLLVISGTLFSTCALAEDKLPEVKFLPDGRVTLASTHWLLSLKIDIYPHGRQIGLLRQELSYFHESVRQQLAPYLDNDSNNHTDILLNSLYHVIESELAKFDVEIDMLRLLYKTIATSFLTPLSTGEDDVWGVIDDDGESDEDATAQMGDTNEEMQEAEFNEDYFDFNESIPNPPTKQPGRQKRAILGFLGPIISGLFGTPSEASWKLAQRNLRTLHQTTEALQSSLGQTLQIVNITNRNIVNNRAAIVDLASDLRHTRTELNEILTSLQDKVESHFRLSTLIERIQALFHVTQSSLRMALNQLNLLKSDLELARQGNFAPTLVPIGQLKTILKRIRAQLPRDVFLPRILTRMDWYYSLPVHLLSDNGNIYIVLDLPLRNMKNRFDLYQVVQFPGEINLKKVSWNLDAPYIAVSRDKSRYVLLSDVDAHLCKDLVCKPNVATMSYIQPRDCMLSLFKNDTRQVWSHCNMISAKFSRGPKLEYKFANVWLAESCVGEVYNVICGSIVKPSQEVVSRVITDRLQKIVLPSDCWMEGQSFVTPKMTVLTTSYEISTNVTFSLMDLSELQTDVEDRRDYDLLNSEPTISLATIQDQNDVISREKDKIDGQEHSFYEETEGSTKWYVVAGPLIAIVVLLFAVVTCYVKRHLCMTGMQPLTRERMGIPLRRPSRQPTDRLPAQPPQTHPIEQVAMGAIQTAAEEGQVVGEIACAPTETATPQVTVPYEYATLAEIPPRHSAVSYLEPGYIPMSK